MPPRRWLPKISALLLLVAVAALGSFLTTFDLNRYRVLVEKGISTTLQRPVKIGEARLSLRHGVALDFNDLRIGSYRQDGSRLEADHLSLKLDLLELLGGRLNVEEVILDAPRLDLVPGDVRAGAPPKASALSYDRLQQLQIRSLRLEGGTIHLRDQRDSGEPYEILLRDLSGRLREISPGRWGSFELSGELVQGPTPAEIEAAGEIKLPADPSRWRDSVFNLALDLRDMKPDSLPSLTIQGTPLEALEGKCSVQLNLSGSLSEGVRFLGKIEQSDLALTLPEYYDTPLQLPSVSLKGVWTSTADTQNITDLRLEAGGLVLKGGMTFSDRKGAPWMEGDLAGTPLPLIDLQNLLPDAKTGPLRRFLETRLWGGTLELERLRLDGPLRGGTPLHSLTARIREGNLHLPSDYEVTRFGALLSWGKEGLRIEEGAFQIAGERMEFSGGVGLSPGSPPEITLQSSGSLTAEKLLSLLGKERLTGLDASGPLAVSLEVSGTPERLLIDLRSDLKFLSLAYEEKLRKPPGLEAELFATAELTAEQFTLNHGLLSIPPIELRSRGFVRRSAERPFELVLDLAPVDMQKVRFRTPLLDPFEPQGKIALDYRLAGSGGTLQQQGGRLLLRNFGMRIPGPLAELNGADGEIEIENGRLTISRLAARLGGSPVTVTGEVATQEGFRCDLRVRSPSMRARDLIFRSEEKVFRDLDGRLTITREGISFSPVTVRLGDRTEAVVRGTLRNFRAPEVRLDIEAPRADIMEVIGLWKGPPRRKKAPAAAKKPKVLVSIEAQVEEGVLGPLQFQKGRALITTRGDHLVIYPLTFEAGQGICTGQVVLDRTVGPPALLQISGDLRDVSAAELQHDLLKRKGLVTGRLNGGFYLEGRLGKTFLPTSTGGFDIRVEDGVLHKFRFLSRVFSLLNVSQLFEFNLPDMEQEGMPFERLTGSFSLRQGILSTEDLFIKSNAMNLSVVGSYDLVEKEQDFVIGVKPLRTVDKIVTQIPVAGWLLTGDEKALFTAHFQVRGDREHPDVLPIPINSLSEKVIGIFRRTFSLPGKLITDPMEVFKGQ